MPRPALLPVLLLAGCIDALYDEGSQLFSDTATATSTGETTTGTGPASPTGGIQTVTTADETSTSGTSTTSTTSDASDPAIVMVDLTPNPIDAPGAIVVDVAAEHADGVRMQREGVPPIELTNANGGHFIGEIEVLTALSNGTHDVTFTPWKANDDDLDVPAQYTVALLDAGSEVVWDTTPDLGQGQVDALAVTADGHVLAFGTYFDGNIARCFLHRRSLDGKPTADLTTIFPDFKCSAVDIVTGDGDGFWLLASVDAGNGPRWRLASGVWGLNPLVVRTGALGEVARALARSPLGQLAVCGTGPSPLPIFDQIDGRVWRIQGPETALDYAPAQVQPHSFDETVTDCTFAGEELRLVGELYGLHEANIPMAPKRKRPFLLALDPNGGAPDWTVPGLGPGNTTQGGATTLTIDGAGNTLMGLYTCGDACTPEPELRRYAPDGTLTWLVTLPANVAIPRELAWSPAGYVVLASAEVITDWETKFLLQAYVPGQFEPAWSYAKATLPNLYLAQAVAVAPTTVVGGGFGSGGFWALAFVAP